MKYLLALGLGVLVGFLLAFGLFASRSSVGISVDEASLANVTSTRVVCGVATTTLLAAQPGRTSFIAQNVGTSTVWLCRNDTFCSSTSGLALYATSSLDIGGNREKFVQEDGYAGQYTCNAPLIVPLNIIYSL